MLQQNLAARRSHLAAEVTGMPALRRTGLAALISTHSQIPEVAKADGQRLRARGLRVRSCIRFFSLN